MPRGTPFGPKITAAATTGPASDPRPTSSVPAIRRKPASRILRSNLLPQAIEQGPFPYAPVPPSSERVPHICFDSLGGPTRKDYISFGAPSSYEIDVGARTSDLLEPRATSLLLLHTALEVPGLFQPRYTFDRARG